MTDWIKTMTDWIKTMTDGKFRHSFYFPPGEVLYYREFSTWLILTDKNFYKTFKFHALLFISLELFPVKLSSRFAYFSTYFSAYFSAYFPHTFSHTFLHIFAHTCLNTSLYFFNPRYSMLFQVFPCLSEFNIVSTNYYGKIELY